MPASWFEELASGGGSREAVGFLVRAERTRRLMLLGELLDRLDEQPDILGELGSAQTAWRLIAEAAEAQPDSLDALLMSPQVGCWIAHMLRRLHGTTDGPPLWVDAGHLFTVCLVARLRAGLDADLAVPVWDGALALPTLGLARIDGGPDGFAVATARLRGPDLHLTSAGRTVGFRPLDGDDTRSTRFRPLRGFPGTTTWLDDLDPYRDLDEPVVPRPLDDSETAAWQRLFGEATDILRTPADGPGRLRVEHVRRIVPWAEPDPGSASEQGPLMSATTGDAFGSMVISRPADGLTLAEAMVHEFQHSKLAALLHLFPLLHDDGSETHYAPWRPDPRHLTGLLHGAYAFTGVTGFWRDRLADKTADPDLAAFHFALRRLQTRLVVRTLLTRARLTAPGRRLLHGLAATLDAWLREPVDPGIAARARAAALSHLVEWRLRNLECGEEERSVLTRAFHDGLAPPPSSLHRPELTAEHPYWADSRFSLYCSPPRTSVTADDHLATGAHREALRLYAEDLRRAPDDRHALAGWLLATAHTTPAHRGLLLRPERLLAMKPCAPQDARRVADWLASPR
ncbi:HEXXH motif domain-containing protein [Streptomyces spongiae]|nr:HEXXH motif domain-containing protein [Streptomyces spongiae]